MKTFVVPLDEPYFAGVEKAGIYDEDKKLLFNLKLVNPKLLTFVTCE